MFICVANVKSLICSVCFIDPCKPGSIPVTVLSGSWGDGKVSAMSGSNPFILLSGQIIKIL